ncbi:MAG: hypothetical protein M9884_17365 [Rhodocyclaceae bacterium]|nr:hypothetical protein [Rhodocyclaceae bacterium]
MTTKKPQATIPVDALNSMLSSIAFTAALIVDRAQHVDYGIIDAVSGALLDAQEHAARMGWLADEAARMIGRTPSRGGADEWLLPTNLRPSNLPKEEA